MPIEIKELIIRASVEPSEKKQDNKNAAADQAELLEECVAQVLEILRREKER